MDANKVRALFFKFYQSKQHQIICSAPMVVQNDPTLMFTNAGMNPFKDIFFFYTNKYSHSDERNLKSEFGQILPN